MKKASSLLLCGLLLIGWPGLQADVGAALLPSHPTPTSPQDLEVDEIQTDGSLSPSRFYRYEDLLTLPLVTVKTQRDSFFDKPATYTGVYFKDLEIGIGAKPTQTILGFICYDQYKPYYDSDYIAKHQPVFLLKLDGKSPAQWPQAPEGTPLGPYCVVHDNFQPGRNAAGEEEDPRIPFGVVKIELSTVDQSVRIFAPKKNVDNPEIQLGYRVAMGNCVNCHNLDHAGGHLAGKPWSLLAGVALAHGTYFRTYVLNPQKLDPQSKMPAHPTYDDKTLHALQVYFKSTITEDN